MFIVYIICYANTYKHKNMHGIIKDTPKLLYIDKLISIHTHISYTFEI